MENFDLAKSLSGHICFVLDNEETELLHVNYTFEKVHDGKLVRISFDGCRPIVGTDFYDVGTCKYDGKVHTIVTSKESIINALTSTQEPLIEVDNEKQSRAIAINTPSTLESMERKTIRGAFSQYSEHFFA